MGVGEALEGDLRQLQPGEGAVGPVEHVDPDLLLHHVDLVAEVLLGDRRRGHAVGLEEQRALQRLGRQRLEVVRVVLVRRAVERAAGGLHQPGVLHLRHVGRPLEHHVLEEVGEAGAPLGLVAHADVVEDAHRHDRHAAVGGEDDAQPVVEREPLHRVPQGQFGPGCCHAPDSNRWTRDRADASWLTVAGPGSRSDREPGPAMIRSPRSSRRSQHVDGVDDPVDDAVELGVGVRDRDVEQRRRRPADVDEQQRRPLAGGVVAGRRPRTAGTRTGARRGRRRCAASSRSTVRSLGAGSS